MKKNINNIGIYQSADFKLLDHMEGQDDSIVYIEGYASVYKTSFGEKQVDRDGEVVNTDNLDIVSYLDNPVLVWNHNWSDPIGKVVSVTKDAKGLYIKAEVHKLHGLESRYEAVKKGLVKSFSIGFIPNDYAFLEGDIVEISRATLVEISIAPVQSNPKALFEVTGTKSLGIKAVDLANSNGITVDELKGIIGNSNKREIMNKNAITKEVTSDAPNGDAQPSTSTETHITTSNNETVTITPSEVPTTPVVETKEEPAKEQKESKDAPLDMAALAESIVKANLEAERLKAEKIQEEKVKLQKEEEEAKQAAIQKAEDAIKYIEAQREIISQTPATEIDVDSLEKLYELVASTQEVIEAKVVEAIATAKANTEA